MSRSKTETTELFTEEKIDAVDSVVSKVTVQATVTTPAKKIGVVRYLQLYPQNEYVEAAMKSQYKTATKTIPDWDKIVVQMNKKFGIK